MLLDPPDEPVDEVDPPVARSAGACYACDSKDLVVKDYLDDVPGIEDYGYGIPFTSFTCRACGHVRNHQGPPPTIYG
ncbi:MAG: hypothetical protein ACI89X_004779 [Planctomycetota bacterium]|jgi:hypothetical protein